MKLLVVVEDDTDMQLLIKVILSGDPRLELTGTASTAKEAIEIARQEQPDLVVLDHFIDGDVMGLQAAPRIKQVAPSAQVLLFTSHNLDVEAQREPAIDRYLNKKDIAELLPTVRKMLGLDRAA